MYPAIRRGRQALGPAACDAILQKGTSGVLALCGASGQPYAVPLSYVYHQGKLYFHCAKAGHKLDLLAENPRASFCVIGQAEKRAAIEALALRYAPDETDAARAAEIDRYWDELCMLELAPDHITGKQCIELV